MRLKIIFNCDMYRPGLQLQSPAGQGYQQGNPQCEPTCMQQASVLTYLPSPSYTLTNIV